MNDESGPSKQPPNPSVTSNSAGPGHRAASRVRGKPFFSSVDASLLGIGSQMLSEVAAGVLLGYGLDYLFGTKNRWIVVGSIAGICVAMVSVFRLALKTQPPRRQPPGSRSDAAGGDRSSASTEGARQAGQRDVKSDVKSDVKEAVKNDMKKDEQLG